MHYVANKTTLFWNLNGVYICEQLSVLDTGIFGNFSLNGGGNFSLSKREFPVALSGAWKNKVERERKGRGAVSGGYRKRCERWAEISTAPAPLVHTRMIASSQWSHALGSRHSAVWWYLVDVTYLLLVLCHHRMCGLSLSRAIDLCYLWLWVWVS